MEDEGADEKETKDTSDNASDEGALRVRFARARPHCGADACDGRLAGGGIVGG